jgi:hypothetical protein
VDLFLFLPRSFLSSSLSAVVGNDVDPWRKEINGERRMEKEEK